MFILQVLKVNSTKFKFFIHQPLNIKFSTISKNNNLSKNITNETKRALKPSNKWPLKNHFEQTSTSWNDCIAHAQTLVGYNFYQETILNDNVLAKYFDDNINKNYHLQNLFR